MKVLGVDVGQSELMVFDSERCFAVPNKPAQIASLLSRYPGWAIILEPTSTYHMQLAERAHGDGRTVYLVNPRDMKHYRESRSFRAKTDRLDAEYLHEYAVAHSGKLRPWEPLSPELRQLKSAIRRWFHLSKVKTKLAQVWEGPSGPELEKLLSALDELLKAVEKEAIQMAKAVDEECFKRTLKAPGVGPFSACGLTFILQSRQFESADAIRAFVGLDLHVEDSGKRKGKRYVTKRGDRILRYCLTCAGRGLLNSRYGRDVNKQLKAKGRHTPERLVIASRKVIRTVFALHQQKTQFEPSKFMWRLDTKT